MMQPSSEIAAVAARIKDRSIQLSSERAVLELVHLEQKEHLASLDDETERSREVRREYLATVRTRHGIELEVSDIETKRQGCSDSIQRDEEMAKVLCEARDDKQAEWEGLVEHVLAPHSVSQWTCRRSIEATSSLRTEAMSTRKRQLDAVRDYVDAIDRKHSSLLEEKERLEKVLDSLKHDGHKEDNEVSAIAVGVRDQIAKRSKLRETVRGQRDALEEANANTLKWEKTSCELASETTTDPFI